MKINKIILFIFFILLAYSVSAVPPIAYSPWGTVTINGVSAPDGLSVDAYINNIKYATTNTINGYYSIEIPGDDPDTPDEIEGGVPGDQVIIKVDGIIASPTLTWVTGFEEVDLTIVINYPPSVTNVRISPTTAYTDTGLTGLGDYSDPNSDSESGSQYKWYKNSAVISGETITTLTSDNFVKGDTIIFEYTPSDGELFGEPVNSSPVTILNSAPTISSYSPINTNPSIDEGSSLMFSVTAADIDNEPLTYSWTLDGAVVSTAYEYTYSPSYDDSGAHTIEVTVSDGSLTATQQWSVTVNNVNRAPVITSYTPQETSLFLDENEMVLFEVAANDPDSDPLTYSWKLDGLEVSTAASYQYQAIPEGCSNGCTVQVDVSDGSLTVSQQWNINVIRIFDIELYNGWNLVSLPVIPLNSSITALLEPIDGLYNSVFAYDAENQNWKSFNTEKPEFLNTLNEIDEKIGFWISMQLDASPVYLTVRGIASGETTFNLKEGWNLISYPALTEQPITTALADIDGIYTSVFAFIDGEWKSYSPEKPSFLNSLQTMQPGYGYWVKVNQDVTWVLD